MFKFFRVPLQILFLAKIVFVEIHPFYKTKKKATKMLPFLNAMHHALIN